MHYIIRVLNSNDRTIRNIAYKYNINPTAYVVITDHMALWRIKQKLHGIKGEVGIIFKGDEVYKTIKVNHWTDTLRHLIRKDEGEA